MLASGRLLRRDDKLVVSHSLYADDMLVFCKGDKQSTSALNESLQKLE